MRLTKSPDGDRSPQAFIYVQSSHLVELGLKLSSTPALTIDACYQNIMGAREPLCF
ncbi:hypothetical protein [Scytonema sp. PCC 10023]|uniref:hypothetical protein n=1 Tax=Scytonema sp. PCC 10023 TaxID=1680591 RepID=UPI0039C760DC